MIRHHAFTVMAVPAAVVVALLAYMVCLAGATPVQRDLRIGLSGLGPGTKPLKLVLLSDLHVAKVGDTPERLRETVSRVNALRPDVVLLAGDFDGDWSLGRYGMRPIAAQLMNLNAPLGVFAVFGNHEYPDADRRVWALKRVGIRFLDNTSARAGALAIVGISDAFTQHDRVSSALAAAKRQGGVPVVLTHSPDAIANLPGEIELALAGHTHCGQVVLPLIGALDTRSRYNQRYRCGIIREGRRTSIVTSGLGVSRLPLRLGAAPDFWVITITPKTK